MKAYLKTFSILLAAVFLLLPAAGLAGGTAFHEDPDAVEQAAQSVLMLTVYDKDGDAFATGSGFVMFDSMTLVTNYHVIDEGVYVTAESDTGEEYDLTKVIAASEGKDIAILRFESPTEMKPLTPSKGTPRRMEYAVAIGSPKGQKNTVSLGNVSSLYVDDGVSWVQHTAPISPGSSGGALFNDSGEVIGITSAAYKDAQNLNLAIDIAEVLVLYNGRSGNQYEIRDAAKADPANGGGTAQVQAPAPKPEETPAPGATPVPGNGGAAAQLGNAKKGDVVTFGSYEQDGNEANGEEPIEWIVLDRQGKKLLLLSRFALATRPYNDSKAEVTWTTCALRKWLNGDFLNDAFGLDELGAVARSAVQNADNAEYGTKGGHNTTDRVFLLSIDEARKYPSAAAPCEGTAAANAAGAFRNTDTGACWWWLRSPGSDPKRAARIDADGRISDGGSAVNGKGYAVRPAIWVKAG